MAAAVVSRLLNALPVNVTILVQKQLPHAKTAARRFIP